MLKACSCDLHSRNPLSTKADCPYTTHSDKITQIRAVQSTDGYYVVMSLCKLPITLLSLCSTRNTTKSLWWSA